MIPIKGSVFSGTGGTVLRVVAVASALTLLLAASAAAAPIIDQQQPVIDTSAGFEYAIGGPSQQKLAQVVTPGMTGVLTEVRFPATCESTLTVEVRGVTNGIPNSTVLGMQTASLPAPFPATFRGISFSTPPPVTDGVPYALVLTTSSVCGMWPGPLGNPYPGGNAFFDSRPNPVGVWVPLSVGGGRSDLAFQTLVETTKSLAADRLADLRNAVIGIGPGRSLQDKVQEAQADLEQDDVSAVCATLNAFIHEVRAQSGKSIPPSTASSLIADATQIRTLLSC